MDQAKPTSRTDVSLRKGLGGWERTNPPQRPETRGEGKWHFRCTYYPGNGRGRTKVARTSDADWSKYKVAQGEEWRGFYGSESEAKADALVRVSHQ